MRKEAKMRISGPQHIEHDRFLRYSVKCHVFARPIAAFPGYTLVLGRLRTAALEPLPHRRSPVVGWLPTDPPGDRRKNLKFPFSLSGSAGNAQ